MAILPIINKSIIMEIRCDVRISLIHFLMLSFIQYKGMNFLLILQSIEYKRVAKTLYVVINDASLFIYHEK